MRTYAKVTWCVNFPWQAGTATHSENSELKNRCCQLLICECLSCHLVALLMPVYIAAFAKDAQIVMQLHWLNSHEIKLGAIFNWVQQGLGCQMYDHLAT